MSFRKIQPHTLWIAAILVFAAVLRFFNIGFQSLWLDELYTMNMADPAHSISEIYALSKSLDGLSVLYFIIVNAFFKLFGFNEEALRSVSAIFGTLGVYGIYLLGRELFSRRTGLMAAALLAVNQFHIQYSQEGRSYAMFATGAIFSFYYMLRFMRDPNWRNSVYYGLCTLFMLLSHFYGMFVIAAQGLIVAFTLFTTAKPQRMQFFLRAALAYAIVVVGFLPILPILQKWAGIKSFWIPLPGTSAFADLYNEFFGTFSVIYLSALFIIFFLLQLFARKQGSESTGMPDDRDEHRSFYVLLCWILVTFFIPYLRSFLVVPMLYGRYMIAMLPAIVLLVAAGIGRIVDTNLRRVAGLLFIVISFLELTIARDFYFRPAKSDFRGAVNYLMNQNFMHAKILTPLENHFGYYLTREKNDAPIVRVDPFDGMVTFYRQSKATPEAFWLLLAHNMTYQLSDSNRTYMEQHYTEAKSIQLLDASARLFIPKEAAGNDTLAFDRVLDLKQFKELPMNEKGELGMYFNTEGSSEPLTLPAGHYKLIIWSQSTPAKPLGGHHAHLSVFLNEQKVGNYYMKPEHFLSGDTLSVDVPEEKAYTVKIRFDNDTMAGTLDRNALIRKVRLIRP